MERTVARHSTSELEVDVVAADILNREEVGSKCNIHINIHLNCVVGVLSMIRFTHLLLKLIFGVFHQQMWEKIQDCGLCGTMRGRGGGWETTRHRSRLPVPLTGDTYHGQTPRMPFRRGCRKSWTNWLLSCKSRLYNAHLFPKRFMYSR